MQGHVGCVLIMFGTQVIKTKWVVRLVFPDYLFVSYHYNHLKVLKFSVINCYCIFIFLIAIKQLSKLKEQPQKQHQLINIKSKYDTANHYVLVYLFINYY